MWEFPALNHSTFVKFFVKLKLNISLLIAHKLRKMHEANDFKFFVHAKAMKVEMDVGSLKIFFKLLEL